MSNTCLKIVQLEPVTQEEQLNTLEAEIRTVSSLGSYFQITISFPLKSSMKTDFTAVHRGPVNIFLSSFLCKLIMYLQKEFGVAEEPQFSTQQRLSIKAASFQTSRLQVLLRKCYFLKPFYTRKACSEKNNSKRQSTPCLRTNHPKYTM